MPGTSISLLLIEVYSYSCLNVRIILYSDLSYIKMLPTYILISWQNNTLSSPIPLFVWSRPGYLQRFCYINDFTAVIVNDMCGILMNHFIMTVNYTVIPFVIYPFTRLSRALTFYYTPVAIWRLNVSWRYYCFDLFAELRSCSETRPQGCCCCFRRLFPDKVYLRWRYNKQKGQWTHVHQNIEHRFAQKL